MRLTTWAAALSILTSTVVIVGAGIVRLTEPLGLRTHPPTPPPVRPVEPGPRSEHGAPALPLGPSRDAHPASTLNPPPAGSVERRAHTVELVIAAAGLCGVPAGIALRLVARESGFRQWDRRGRPLRSSANAIGLTQIKPSTARDLSPTLDIWNSEWENALAGLCVLSGHFSRSGSWREALYDYYGGPNRKRTTAAHRAYSDVILGAAQ